MAIFTMNLLSNALMKETQVTVILPCFNEYEEYNQPDEKFQTLWLLHGGGESFTQYTTRTNIYRLANNNKVAVVLPDTGTNHYNNIPGGPSYYDYISEELPALLRKHLPLSDKREDNFIFGHSMGGYGAFKCAMDHPENYGAVGLLSTGPQSALQLRSLGIGLETPGFDRYTRIFGGTDKIPESINDPWWMLAKAVQEKKNLPLIFDGCGTDDRIYAAYRAFLDYADSLGVKIDRWEAPGWHSWDFWNQGLEKFFEWLPLLKYRDFLKQVEEKRGCIQPQLNDPELVNRIQLVKDTYFSRL